MNEKIIAAALVVLTVSLVFLAGYGAICCVAALGAGKVVQFASAALAASATTLALAALAY